MCLPRATRRTSNGKKRRRPSESEAASFLFPSGKSQELSGLRGAVCCSDGWNSEKGEPERAPTGSSNFVSCASFFIPISSQFYDPRQHHNRSECYEDAVHGVDPYWVPETANCCLRNCHFRNAVRGRRRNGDLPSGKRMAGEAAFTLRFVLSPFVLHYCLRMSCMPGSSGELPSCYIATAQQPCLP